MLRTTHAALLAALMSLALAPSASAHGGGLDKNGCHTNRKTGDYHCHRGNALPRGDTLAPKRQAPSVSPSRLHAPRQGAFANCDEARAAGAAPVHRGDPGYGPHLDRDNDGIGCEPYRGRR